MIFKLRCALLGGHVHVDVFMGPDADHLALSGTLVMDPDEATVFSSKFAWVVWKEPT